VCNTTAAKRVSIITRYSTLHRRNTRGTRGTGTPTFWTEGFSTPTFQDEKVKNLLSPAVNRGDLWRLNYNKTIFGLGSAPDLAGRAHDALPDPKSDEEGILPPHSHHYPPFSARNPWAPHSPSE